MMFSCGGGIARRRGDHDSVDKVAEFDKAIHWKLRICYNLRQAVLARHPGRKNECGTVFPPHEYMFDTAMLVPTGQNIGLASQRMKRIGDCDFLRRNPGTMSPLRTTAVAVPRPSTPSSKPPYAARGIARFMPPAALCRVGSFSPDFSLSGV